MKSWKAFQFGQQSFSSRTSQVRAVNLHWESHWYCCRRIGHMMEWLIKLITKRSQDIAYPLRLDARGVRRVSLHMLDNDQLRIDIYNNYCINCLQISPPNWTKWRIRLKRSYGIIQSWLIQTLVDMLTLWLQCLHQSMKWQVCTLNYRLEKMWSFRNLHTEFVLCLDQLAPLSTPQVDLYTRELNLVWSMTYTYDHSGEVKHIHDIEPWKSDEKIYIIRRSHPTDHPKERLSGPSLVWCSESLALDAL